MFFRLLSDAPVPRPVPVDLVGPGVWSPMAGLHEPRPRPAGELLVLRPERKR